MNLNNMYTLFQVDFFLFLNGENSFWKAKLHIEPWYSKLWIEIQDAWDLRSETHLARSQVKM